MLPEIRDVFAQAGCDGWLTVLDIDGEGAVRIGGDEPAVAASVFKVIVALEAFRQAEEGRLDLLEAVRLRPEERTFGPTGFSLFADAAEASVRDLVTMMLTISDNTATDALVDRVGLDRLAATSAELGLKDTVIPFTLRTMLESAQEDVVRPAGMIRTTADDMARLLRLIWRNEAGPAAACVRVRKLMARQLTRHRLAMGFPREVTVAAKSGGLFGVVRNEIGVVAFPDGRRYAAAVFTRAHVPYARENEINTSIGVAAALAISHV